MSSFEEADLSRATAPLVVVATTEAAVLDTFGAAEELFFIRDAVGVGAALLVAPMVAFDAKLAFRKFELDLADVVVLETGVRARDREAAVGLLRRSDTALLETTRFGGV